MSSTYMERNVAIDAIRGFAIILVVFGHCIQYGSGNVFLSEELYWDNWLYRTIYSFHMPLFALVSGYLIYGQIQRQTSFLPYFIKQVKSLLLPIFCWTLLDFSATSLLGRSIDFNLLLKFLGRLATNLWFLWAVFYASMFLAILHFFFHHSIFPAFILILMLLAIPNDWNLSVYVWTLPFFFLGYYAKMKNIEASYILKFCLGTKGLIISVVLFLFVLFCSSIIMDSPYRTGMQIDIFSDRGGQSILKDLYYWTIGIVGSLPVIIFFLYMYRLPMRFPILPKLGKMTLGIYAFSTLINYHLLVRITDGFSSSFFINVIETIIILLISCFVTIIMQRVSLLNILFLGGRKR